MMDWTDRHCRYFLRLISKHTLLYTEMVTTGAILHGDTDRHLAFHPDESPVALQVGGSDPVELAQCVKLASGYGYSEININVGCPSDRVQSGRFGACLMAEPDLVADCIASMRAQASIPVTIKTRVGIDDMDSYAHLCHFVGTTADAGCEIFILHARKAWLKGLSPKENREIPPLQYDTVAKLKKDFPHLTVVLNGGVKTLDEAAEHLKVFDGVMIGREAYSNPFLLAEVDRRFYQSSAPSPSRAGIISKYSDYLEEQLHAGTPLQRMTKHLLGLFQGQPGARRWRRYISENAHGKNAGVEVVAKALQYTQDA